MLIEQMTRYEGRQDPNAGRYLFLDAVQRMSQFIEGVAAPTFGDFGDGDEIGAALSWGAAPIVTPRSFPHKLTIVHYPAIQS
jgi:hypothetical protein